MADASQRMSSSGGERILRFAHHAAFLGVAVAANYVVTWGPTLLIPIFAALIYLYYLGFLYRCKGCGSRMFWDALKAVPILRLDKYLLAYAPLKCPKCGTHNLT